MPGSMKSGPIHIALETSGRRGSVAVGRGDALLESVDLAEQRRHAVELLPMLDALGKRHGFGPAHIGECYVSIGPGSFTGLRVAVTAAKMLARVHGTKLIAVPTLDVVVRNIAEPTSGGVAVMLNAKGGRCFTGIYDRQDDAWIARDAPALLTPTEAMEKAGVPLTIIADKLPDCDLPDDVTVLDGDAAVAKAEHVWHLGRMMAKRGTYVDAYELAPLYVRLPDAEEKWRQRQQAEVK